MTYSYFPGCTLKSKAKELDEYARASAEVLGFTLEEIPEWQCCGGVYPLGSSEIAPKLPSIRALSQAKDSNQDLVTLCSACYNDSHSHLAYVYVLLCSFDDCYLRFVTKAHLQE